MERRPHTQPRTLAIDPGLRELGAAEFEGDALHRIGVLVNPNRRGRDVPAWAAMGDLVKSRFPSTDELVIEMMVVRAGRRDVDPDDLMQLVGIAGVLVGLYAPIPARVVRPEDWKGRVKKRIHHQRIVGALNPNERRLIERFMEERADTVSGFRTLQGYLDAARRCRGNDYPNDPIHNAIDAVGIGLHARGRL